MRARGLSAMLSDGRQRLRALLLVAVFVVIAGSGAWFYVTRPYLTPTEKGRRLAEQMACFACHGADGSGGVPNPGRVEGVVPNWRGDLMMFARDTSQIREWIRDGVTAARAQSQSWQQERSLGALRMPAFGKRLSETQIGNLVALVAILGGKAEPEDSLALYGFHRADSLACFSCHGPGGRYARPNPGSFKGYVASWQAADFQDLVESRPEFDEWVTDGICRRLAGNRAATYFLKHAVLKMPAFRSHLRPGDLDALWAYVTWLRSEPVDAAPP
jgi:mono/diheme cytochrome c family protein